MERTRESMARELVNLSNSNQEQEVKLQELESLKKRYKVTRSLARSPVLSPRAAYKKIVYN